MKDNDFWGGFVAVLMLCGWYDFTGCDCSGYQRKHRDLVQQVETLQTRVKDLEWDRDHPRK